LSHAIKEYFSRAAIFRTFPEECVWYCIFYLVLRLNQGYLSDALLCYQYNWFSINDMFKAKPIFTSGKINNFSLCSNN